LEPIATAAAIGPYSGPALRIDSVHVPPSMDRIEITTERAPGEIRINDLDHWAAPLGQLVRQALTADLMARLPEGRVIFPHLVKSQGAIGINLDILAFSADAKGRRLEASWIMTSDDSKPASAPRTVLLEDDTPTAGAAATARALSVLLAQLADRISDELVARTVWNTVSRQLRAPPHIRGARINAPHRRKTRVDDHVVHALYNCSNGVERRSFSVR
jgi:uncharacterized lipoprotein YmbA